MFSSEFFLPTIICIQNIKSNFHNTIHTLNVQKNNLRERLIGSHPIFKGIYIGYCLENLTIIKV